jgi:hypothetical protein
LASDVSRRIVLPLQVEVNNIKTRRTERAPRINCCSYVVLDYGYVKSLGAFVALSQFELDVCAFLQRLEAFAANGTEVHENIFATVSFDETEAFVVVKPFHFTCYAICHDIYLLYAGILEGRNLIGEIWHQPDFLEALFNYQATLGTLVAKRTKHKVHVIWRQIIRLSIRSDCVFDLAVDGGLSHLIAGPLLHRIMYASTCRSP